MAHLATDTQADFRGRVRCSLAFAAHFLRVTKSFRVFSAEGAYTVCGRANQRRFAVAEWFQPSRKAKAVDFQSAEFLPLAAIRQVGVPPCSRGDRRLLPDLREVRSLSRQALFDSRLERHHRSGV